MVSAVRYFLSILLSVLLSFGPAYAFESTSIQQTSSFEVWVDAGKSLENAKNVFEFSDALSPQLKLDGWVKFANQLQVGLMSIKMADVRFKNNNLYLAGKKYPFVISTKNSSFSYRGVSFQFDFKKSPSENYILFNQAFKNFRELSKTQSTAFSDFFISPANADVAGGLALTFFALAALYGMKTAAAIIGTGVLVVGGIVVAGAAVIALLTAVVWMANKVYSKTAPFMGIELKCTNPPRLVDVSTSQDVSKVVLAQSAGPYPAEVLRNICESSDKVESFNKALFFMKTKLMNGELDAESLRRAREAQSAYIKSLPVTESMTGSGATQ